MASRHLRVTARSRGHLPWGQQRLHGFYLTNCVDSVHVVLEGIENMPKKQSSSKMSTLAAKVLAGKKPTLAEAKKLAGSVMGQDEKKGQGK